VSPGGDCGTRAEDAFTGAAIRSDKLLVSMKFTRTTLRNADFRVDAGTVGA
jgi:hypothetical protein